MRIKSRALAFFFFAVAGFCSAQDFFQYPGTKLYIRMPDKLKLMPFTGIYTRDDGVEIEATETGGNVTTVINETSAAYKNGAPSALGNITNYERLEAYSIFVEYEPDPDQIGFDRILRLITGNGQTLVVLTCRVPPLDDFSVNELRNSIKTAKWNKALTKNFSKLLYFTADFKKYSLAEFDGGGFAFRYSGKKKEAADISEGFIGTVALSSSLAAADYEVAAASFGACDAYRQSATMWRAEPTTLGSLPGIKISYACSDEGVPLQGLVVAYFKPDRVFFLSGKTRATDPAYYDGLLESFFSSFKLK